MGGTGSSEWWAGRGGVKKYGCRRAWGGEGRMARIHTYAHTHTNIHTVTFNQKLTHISCRHALLRWIHQELAQQIQCLQQIRRGCQLMPRSLPSTYIAYVHDNTIICAHVYMYVHTHLQLCTLHNHFSGPTSAEASGTTSSSGMGGISGKLILL